MTNVTNIRLYNEENIYDCYVEMYFYTSMYQVYYYISFNELYFKGFAEKITSSSFP